MNFNPTVQIQERNEEEQEEQDKLEAEEKARCEWAFNLRATVSSSSSSSNSTTPEPISDTLGATEFDTSGHFLATAGIARKIRLYTLTSLLSSSPSPPLHLDHTSACDYYICTPAKLSSLRWKPNTDSHVLGTGDYDGVVTEYDLERRVPIFERDEHGGRRVWSVDYRNSVCASGSDDGTMQVWDTRCGGTNLMGLARPSETRSPVCCVEFSPFAAQLQLALGCADRRAYVYDLRRMERPVCVLVGHENTVSYVRFMGGTALVTSGTDACLKMWDLDGARVVRTYKGHVNRRNFVGLAVLKSGGLIGCGSESGEVFVYDKRWGEPIWVCGFVGGPGDKRFVGSVGWREVGEDECTLVAGTSDGVLQVFAGRRLSS